MGEHLVGCWGLRVALNSGELQLHLAEALSRLDGIPLILCWAFTAMLLTDLT